MYLAVLNYELHSALIETVQRAEKQPTIITQPPAPPKGKKRASKGKIPLDIPKENLESPVIPKDKRVRIIQEAKSLLEKNVDLLEHEPQFSTGYDMAVLAKISLAQVESTLKTYL